MVLNGYAMFFEIGTGFVALARLARAKRFKCSSRTAKAVCTSESAFRCKLGLGAVIKPLAMVIWLNVACESVGYVF